MSERTTELTIAHRKPSGSFADVWSAQKIPWCLSISRLCFIMKIPSWGKSRDTPFHCVTRWCTLQAQHWQSRYQNFLFPWVWVKYHPRSSEACLAFLRLRPRSPLLFQLEVRGTISPGYQ